ncbi:MAG: ferritin-like domain-containing protein [Myxococcota bacterium]|nr:ferritin-like domain-containing protein [Myxococcota bacterium]
MISARSIFEEIRSNDEAYRLFLSLGAKGEGQGGFENARIAELTPDPELAGKIARHGEDEGKHERLFLSLLRKRGLDVVPIPLRADYCMRLEQAGVGLSHERLSSDEPLSFEEVLAYLVHSRVTEQRGAEEVFQQKQWFGREEPLGKAIHMIAEDEENHLAYCHEELLRFVDAGHGQTVRRMLDEYARKECVIYHDMSRAVLDEMSRILGWSPWKRGLLQLGLSFVGAWDRLYGWRRLTRLEPQTRKNPMAPRSAGPAPA